MIKKLKLWLDTRNPWKQLHDAEALIGELYQMLSETRRTVSELRQSNLDNEVALRHSFQVIDSRNRQIDELCAKLGDTSEWIGQVTAIEDECEIIAFPTSTAKH